MSKKFYAVNRQTGERWKPICKDSVHKNYLVMYDSGYLAEVIEYTGAWDSGRISMIPLNPKIWKPVIKESILKE